MGCVNEIKLEAFIDNTAAARDFADECLAAAGCPRKVRMQLGIVVDEIFSNIARYAYADRSSGGGGTAVITADTSAPGCAVLTFADEGVPYNPLEHPDPDTALPASERGIGGLGIFMSKKLTDEMTYAYIGGRNVLTVKKLFDADVRP